jgi:hypothetical protein
MIEILKTHPDFKIFPNLEEEKRALGEENWHYMQKYGIGDTRYPMTYREIPRPELAEAASTTIVASNESASTLFKDKYGAFKASSTDHDDNVTKKCAR